MCSKPLWLSLVSAAVLSVGCSSGVSVLDPVVEGIEPGCGNRAEDTAVTVRGTLPVKIVPDEGGEATLDSTYHAWVGSAALTYSAFARYVRKHIGRADEAAKSPGGV